MGKLLFIDLGGGKNRLGGSALAQVFGQVGNVAPDIDDAGLLKRAFNAVQELVRRKLILAGHDRSDGGLITTLLEMAFPGNCGFEVNIPADEAGTDDPLALFFCEEAGVVLEYQPENEAAVFDILSKARVPHLAIGAVLTEPRVKAQSTRLLVHNRSKG